MLVRAKEIRLESRKQNKQVLDIYLIYVPYLKYTT